MISQDKRTSMYICLYIWINVYLLARPFGVKPRQGKLLEKEISGKIFIDLRVERK